MPGNVQTVAPLGTVATGAIIDHYKVDMNRPLTSIEP
jgi:hypothetical protein